MNLFLRKIIAWNMTRNLDVDGIIENIPGSQQCRHFGRLLFCRRISKKHLKCSAVIQRKDIRGIVPALNLSVH